MFVISPDRQILILVAGMVAGVVARLAIDSDLVSICAGGLGIAMLVWQHKNYLGKNLASWHQHSAVPGMQLGLIVQHLAFGISVGGLALAVQFARAPDVMLASGVSTTITGQVITIDGNTGDRARLWVQLSAPVAGLQRDQIVRISTDIQQKTVMPADWVSVPVHLYPPPSPMLPGAPDYGLQARVRGVVASGFATQDVRVIAAVKPDRTPVKLSAFRHKTANYLAANMEPPAGGIAAALLVGDRRMIGDATQEVFRRSGLAHLLAISGLHMGLLCFGVIGLLRTLGALAPVYASRIPLHKYCAVLGVVAAGGYVLLSGMPISAIRAFLMASLVIGALMLDRLALTLRNVALAALVILLVNPLALLTAGFQLSLSATLALVLWYEALMRARVIGSDGVSGTDGTPRWPKPVRYLLGLVTTSLIAGFATMPFAAQHFGGVTAWGVLANIFGIPLTGLWIMPAGLLATIVHALPFPLWLDQLSLVVMETGIMMLVAVAGFFADQPYAGWRVIPPGYGLLCLGLFGWLITMLDRNTRWQKICGSGVVAAALVLWSVKPPPDAVFLARGQTPILLVAGPERGVGVMHAGPYGRRLSDFSANTAAFFLAREVKPQIVKGVTATWHGRSEPEIVRDRRGRRVAIVRHKAALTKACQAKAAYVLSFVTARYPCGDATPILDLSGLAPANYLLSIDEQGRLFATGE